MSRRTAALALAAGLLCLVSLRLQQGAAPPRSASPFMVYLPARMRIPDRPPFFAAAMGVPSWASQETMLAYDSVTAPDAAEPPFGALYCDLDRASHYRPLQPAAPMVLPPGLCRSAPARRPFLVYPPLAADYPVLLLRPGTLRPRSLSDLLRATGGGRGFYVDRSGDDPMAFLRLLEQLARLDAPQGLSGPSLPLARQMARLLGRAAAARRERAATAVLCMRSRLDNPEVRTHAAADAIPCVPRPAVVTLSGFAVPEEARDGLAPDLRTLLPVFLAQAAGPGRVPARQLRLAAAIPSEVSRSAVPIAEELAGARGGATASSARRLQLCRDFLDMLRAESGRP